MALVLFVSGMWPVLVVGQAPDTTLERSVESTNQRPSSRPKAARTRHHHSSDNAYVVIGGDVVVKENETVPDVVVIGGSAVVEGKITQDLVVIMGGVKLGPRAEVRKEVVVIGGTLDVDPGATIGSSRVVLGPGDALGHVLWPQWAGQWFTAGLMHGRLLPHQHWWAWATAGVALLFYLTLALLFPLQVQQVVTTLTERPGKSWLAGVLGFTLLGPFLALLAITVVGVVLIPVALLGFVCALAFGRAAMCRYAGHQVGGQLGIPFLQQPLLALLVGALVLCLLYTVPVVGLLALLATTPLGLGAVLLTVFRAKSRAAGEGAGADSAVAGPLESSAAISGRVPYAARAGFWLRLLASGLDMLLVGIVVGVLLHRQRLFFPVWAVYHLAFWSWRGTTVGGLILGLRVVRLDGQPMNFGVALIRLFGSLFSFAAGGLGFFWAGWSRERQSWHDKIAGTVVIKGVPVAGVYSTLPSSQ